MDEITGDILDNRQSQENRSVPFSLSRKVILEWPDYWMLKSRVVLALSFCALAFVIGLGGLYWIAEKESSLGAALMLSGWLSSAAVLATVSLARWRIRELLGE